MHINVDTRDCEIHLHVSFLSSPPLRWLIREACPWAKVAFGRLTYPCTCCATHGDFVTTKVSSQRRPASGRDRIIPWILEKKKMCSSSHILERRISQPSKIESPQAKRELELPSRLHLLPRKAGAGARRVQPYAIYGSGPLSRRFASSSCGQAPMTSYRTKRDVPCSACTRNIFIVVLASDTSFQIPTSSV